MVKRRRLNFLPTLVLIIFFWTTFVFMIFFIEPEMVKDIILSGLYLPFFINLFLALFLTLAVVFANSKKSLYLSAGIIIFLLLRLFHLGNALNIVLLMALIFTLDRHFTSNY